MKSQPLAITPLEDRLTPADVVINYIIYFVEGGASFGTPTLGGTGLTNANLTNNALTNTGLNNSVRTGFSGLDTNATGFPGLDATGVGQNVFGNAGLGATSFGMTGLGAGGLTNPGTGGVGPSTVITGTNGLTGTNLVGNGVGGFNTGTGFGTTANGFNGTGLGGSNGVFTGNGLNTVNNFNAINGLSGANGFTTTTIPGANTSGLTPFIGSSGFGFSGTEGVTINTTITPNGGSPLITGTTNGGVGTVTPTADEIAVARATRSVLQSEAGDVGVVLNPFPGYAGELRTAVADVTGDGVADTIVAPGEGGGPRVAVFDGRTGQIVADFFAYDDALRDGIFIAAGDLTGDGRAEIVTGAGAGGGPRVRAFTLGNDGRAVNTADFFAFDPNFRGGVTVAVGDALGNGVNSILTGAGVGGGPRVDVFSATGEPQRTLFAGDINGRSGIDVAGIARPATGPALLAAGGSQAGLYDPVTGELLSALGTADAVNPSVVSLATVSGQQVVRVARDGQPEGLFDLNGVAVG